MSNMACNVCGKIYNARGKARRCRECINKSYRELRKKDPLRYRGYVRKHMRGIDRETYETMQKAQYHTCAICHKKPTKKQLAVDHCHKTGKIRGLLCDTCNRALGMFDDDIEILQSAIRYLNA